MSNEMQQLTRAEEEVMQYLWELEMAFVKELVEQFEEPKPAYNTVSTIIRILEKKGFVAYKAFGRTHQYYPIISKEDYLRYSANTMVNKYFSGSFERMVSFFAKDQKISASELEKVMNEIKKSKS